MNKEYLMGALNLYRFPLIWTSSDVFCLIPVTIGRILSLLCCSSLHLCLTFLLVVVMQADQLLPGLNVQRRFSLNITLDHLSAESVGTHLN